MNLIEKYVFLFTDTLYSNFVLSAKSELALGVMRYLEQTNLATWVITFAAVGISANINYFFGIIAYNIFIKYSIPPVRLRYDNICLLWRRYYLPIMLFCVFHPLASIIIFFAGFVKFNFARSTVVLLACKALSYVFV